MANVKIRYFVAKPGRHGVMRYFWQPTAALKSKGWNSIPLKDARGNFLSLGEAMQMAEKINTDLDAWRKGDTGLGDHVPAQGPAPGTLNALIDLYRQDPAFTELVEKSRLEYGRYLDILAKWAGDMPVAGIRKKSVKALYDAFRAKPRKAQFLIQVLRKLMSFAIDQEWIQFNPASRPGIKSNPPRQVIWEDREVDHMVATADKMDMPSIGTALLMGCLIGQRQGDIIRMSKNRLLTDRIGPYFSFNQSKNAKPVKVRPLPEVYDRFNLAGTDVTTILMCERLNKPYTSDRFTKDFAMVREEAAKEMPSVAGKWFMDSRTTCVVWMGEEGLNDEQISSVTGHTLDSTKRILETYAVRTSKMAHTAIESLGARRERYRQDLKKKQQTDSHKKAGSDV